MSARRAWRSRHSIARGYGLPPVAFRYIRAHPPDCTLPQRGPPVSNAASRPALSDRVQDRTFQHSARCTRSAARRDCTCTGHVLERRIEAQILRLQLGLALAQGGGSLLDKLIQPAIELFKFRDHQCNRAVGAVAVAIRFFVGFRNKRKQRFQIELAGAFPPWRSVWRGAYAPS